ncbi:MAG: hypothetical protein HYW34_03795 [Candidatus Brennerbacteria bacterium]|nr:hypothetical protein [Candidatus Brennerbacteria bacterium]
MFIGENSKLKAVIAFLGLALIIAFGWKILGLYGVVPSYDFPAVSASQWQAVFLTNNQVYFGHLKNYNRGYSVLKDIYYLRVTDPLQQGSPPQQPSINLVKLGGELHGPSDVMYIPKDKIMFWENLKDDSQVVQAISNFLKQQ